MISVSIGTACPYRVPEVDIQARLYELLSCIGVPSSRWKGLWSQVKTQYSTSNRVYHNLDHINYALDKHAEAGNMDPYFTRDVLGEVALWVHDMTPSVIPIITESILGNSEQVHKVLQIVKDLDHDTIPALESMMCVDGDLAILASEPHEYFYYKKAIRKEHDEIGDADFYANRLKILERFLAKDRIFWHLSHLNQKARLNISREIAGIHARSSGDRASAS